MDFYRMREEAIGYYENSPTRVQIQLHRFFDSMDTNGDRSVNFDKIYDFLKGKTFLTRLLNGVLFDGLDEDGDGNLDFYEFITLFYVIFTMFRCNECRNRLVGQPHFTCVVCFTSANANNTYDICGSCYRRGYYNHRHHPRRLVNYREFILDGGQNNPMHFDQRRPKRQVSSNSPHSTVLFIVSIIHLAITNTGHPDTTRATLGKAHGAPQHIGLPAGICTPTMNKAQCTCEGNQGPNTWHDKLGINPCRLLVVGIEPLPPFNMCM
ncbi:hypothetical protein QQ045_032833 [Rhodiola kirilowii]